MDKLKVEFDEPEHGWIGLSVANGEQIVSIDADSRSESFRELITALLCCLEDKGEYVATWLEEPHITELHFEKRNETITLRIFGSDVSSYPKIHVEPELTAIGSYSQICLPFWRALHSLQGRYSEQQLKELIQDDFPTELFAGLTKQVESYKLQQKQRD
jgi:hypothetical protein